MTTIRSILNRKGPEVFSIGSQATVYEAIDSMARHNIGALLVNGDDGEAVGIVTERDYLRKVALKGLSSKTTAVSAIMSSPVLFAGIGDSIESCMAKMTEQRCRHLPVRGEQDLAGLISIGDLIRQIAHDRGIEIQELQDFIQGR